MADRTVTMTDSPYKGTKLMDEAWSKGYEARAKDQPKASCPYGDYPGKQFRRAWLEGWDAAAPVVTMPSAPPGLPIRVQSPPIATPGSSWPMEKPLPTHYQRPRSTPCPKCRSVVMKNGHSQAVILRSTSEDIAYLWCRACDHLFRLPIEPAK